MHSRPWCSREAEEIVRVSSSRTRTAVQIEDVNAAQDETREQANKISNELNLREKGSNVMFSNLYLLFFFLLLIQHGT